MVYAWVTFAKGVIQFICLRFFLYNYSSMVGGLTSYDICKLHCLQSSCDFFRWQARTKPYRDLAEILLLKPHNVHVIFSRAYDHFWAKMTKILRCPHNQCNRSPYWYRAMLPAMCLQATGLRFLKKLSYCGVKQNRRGYDTCKSVYDGMVSLRRLHWKDDMDILRAS